MTDATQDISFYASHKPALEDGDYTLTVEQTASVNGQGLNSQAAPPPVNFSVRGPRYSLKPNLIQSVFPPEKTLGEYYNIMPHIILDRTTLPWERTMDSTTNQGWLALLLFDYSEISQVQSSTVEKQPLVQSNPLDVQALVQSSTVEVQSLGTDTSVQFPKPAIEFAQQPTDRVNVIDVPFSLLENILPTEDDLKLLSHVRKLSDESTESAVILGNRLPKAGNESVVHLVSLENRTDLYPATSPAGTTLFRLVSLYNWHFASVGDTVTFSSVCEKLTVFPPSPSSSPTTTNPAQPYLDQGYHLLHHQTRQGNKLASWYRGPCIPGTNTDSLPANSLPAASADYLMRYWSDLQMFEPSYAAAWELGKLLTLANTHVATALFQWKQAMKLATSQSTTPAQHVVKIFGVSAPTPPPVPDNVSAWFLQLSQLQHIPFHYLVPEDDMLPQESIRFFNIDPLWIQCLLDGAYSIGRVTIDDQAQDKANEAQVLPPQPSWPMSGFFLRSKAISAWPNFQVYTGTSSQMTQPVSNNDLGSSVRITLFSDIITNATLQEKPEGIHTGVDYDSDTKVYSKTLRDPNTGTPTGSPINVVWKNGNSDNLVIDFTTMLAGKNISDSGTFAVSMIETVKGIVFNSASSKT